LRRKTNVKKHSRREFLKRSGCVALVMAGARVANAHAKLVRSEPENAARLSEAPKTVELWFNELLDDEFNTVEIFPAKEVTRKDRQNLIKAKAKVDAKDRTHLSVDLPALAPNSYIVEYRVLSRDGHTAPGRLNFTVLAKS
jgi:methionine-rich copper-binding protein CopC